MDTSNQDWTARVSGTLRDTLARPVVQFLVRAFDKNVGGESVLGEAQTDESGRYEIRYRVPDACGMPKPHADLVVRAFGPDGPLVATSSLILNASADEHVDLNIGNGQYAGPSVYETLLSTLTPLIACSPLERWTADDVDYAARKTNTITSDVSLLVSAVGAQNETKIPAEAFFAFGRGAPSADIASVLARTDDELRVALLRALRDNVIPPRFKPEIPEIFALVDTARVAQAFRASPAGTALEPLLTAITPSTGELARRYLAHEGTITDFWSSLKGDATFDSVADDLQLTVQFAALARNHVPMVKALQGLRASGKATTARDLAQLTKSDWSTPRAERQPRPATSHS